MNQKKVSKHSQLGQTVLKLLISNELRFSKLYLKYAALFEDQSFWNTLAAEEKRHAQWLEALLASSDVFDVKTDLLPIESLKLFGEDIDLEIKHSLDITFYEALARSLRLEESFFEKSYFEFISPDTASVRRVIEDLKRETKDHIFLVKQKLDKYQI